MGFINNTVPVIISNSGDIIKKSLDTAVCSFESSKSTQTLLWLILGILFFTAIIIYRKKILENFRKIQAKKGYIKIMMILPNKHIKDIFKTLSIHNTFDFKSKTYSMEKMTDYIIGYDKNNMPIFLFHNNFIVPLKMEQTEISEQVKKSYEESTGETIDNDKLTSLLLKIDATILNTVYKRKLLSDLYSISTAMNPKTLKWILIAVGGLVLVFMYNQGMLDKLLDFAGVNVG